MKVKQCRQKKGVQVMKILKKKNQIKKHKMKVKQCRQKKVVQKMRIIKNKKLKNKNQK